MREPASTHRELPLTRDSAVCLRALAEGDLTACIGKLERLMRAQESKVVPKRDLAELASVFRLIFAAKERLAVLVQPYNRTGG